MINVTNKEPCAHTIIFQGQSLPGQPFLMPSESLAGQFVGRLSLCLGRLKADALPQMPFSAHLQHAFIVRARTHNAFRHQIQQQLNLAAVQGRLLHIRKCGAREQGHKYGVIFQKLQLIGRIT